ncbi:MAG TPA: MDR family MFS transporter [Verrucomicrobiae bacterium]|nr:MDR family MFS transporter [Verrucomicrobiae bacterium]
MTDATAEAALHLSPRAKLEILGAMLLAMFLFALDQTVVGTALPKIITDLNGNSLYTWSVAIYLLTSTISGPIYGKLSDLYGRRPIVIFAVGLFLVASALSGLSQTMEQFILFRGLQGLGGGAIFPIALAVVADLYTPAERGKYLGSFGAVFGLSSLIGPWLGGTITDNFGWHWIFYINIPIGLISLFILWRLLPAIRRPEAGQNIDYLGAAVFAAAVAPFLIGLSNKQTGEWTDPAVGGLMLLGLVFLPVFIWVESRAADPIVPLGLFRLRTFTISVAAMFFAGFGFLTGIIFLPRWFQSVAGVSATESGFNILPLLFGLIISAVASGQIVARIGRYKWLMFGSLLLLGLALFLMTNLRTETDRPILWLWMALAGLGIGPSFAVFTLIVQNAVSPDRIGVATSSLTFFQQIGGTVGLTIAGTLFADRIKTEIPTQLLAAGVPPQIVQGFSSGGAGAQLDLTGTGDLGAKILAGTPDAFKPIVEPQIHNIVAGIHEAFSIAIANTFWAGIVAAIAAAILVLFLHEVRMRTTFEGGATLRRDESPRSPEGSIAAG